MAQSQPVRASVFDMMKQQPSAMDQALIRPAPAALFRSWQTASLRTAPR